MAHDDFDPRMTPFKDGKADQRLQGLMRAESFVVGETLACAAPVSAIRSAPNDSAEQLDQLLFGERFRVIERSRDYVWGQALRDGYCGYVRETDLSRDWFVPTHYVSTLRSYVFSEPNLKSRINCALSLNALVSVTAEDGKYSQLNDLGWIYTAHLSDFTAFGHDYVSVAETYLNAPYQWGGRESDGLDCSGLVQQALYAVGQACPRDSDMQSHMGDALDIGTDLKGLYRGDLVFWKGHVAIMRDEDHIIHANGHHMKTVIEPLRDAVDRIEAAGVGKPIAFRRL
ncbi:NlpC/P60 family protein [Asticcacaulis sp. AND118]|uniref:C40 family peptidase n=1 Tax=Asticcacaulis sp. AND118 TaxID=2840468 RepID=UPI001CFF81B6|nr:NlpC/P60 family protein [Asticcacaulis sp. AND118]UDF03805.1 NlpC/P60 family protein [Asticcacaulis sp. AND118]